MIGKGLSGIVDATWSVEASTAGISALSNEQRPILFDLSLVSIPNNQLSSLKIYPNPIGNYDKLLLESRVAPLFAELYDSQGGKIALKAEISSAGTYYQLNGLQAGIYFWKAQFPDGSVMVKKLMVIQHE